jgi:ribonucleoside-triphosphate reductase (thioredoxin)
MVLASCGLIVGHDKYNGAVAELVDAPDLKSVTLGCESSSLSSPMSMTELLNYLERISMISLPTDYQTFIATSRYARWLDDEKRREYWPETVSRYMEFMDAHLREKHKYKMPVELKAELLDAIIGLEIMPSMRGLMTAGPALTRENVAGYNCSYTPVNHPRCFDEILYILMNGVGVGFSVERDEINQLPIVNEHFEDSTTTITVADSKSGWARALRELIAMLYAGQKPLVDYSLIRPAGARLKTFGGRASGPAPLEDLFKFTAKLFEQAAGRKLTSLECHDLVCKIAEVVVVGGVRRSALISLSNLSDGRMRNAKSGQWWEDNVQRSLANNSVAYSEKPGMDAFMEEWLSLYQSKSGERGIFNREAAVKQAAKNRRRDTDYAFGTNPCSEIILRPHQFCNLTEVVVRAEDDLVALKRKVRLATILGTMQATLTDFKYLRKVWKHNTEEERLLGVSLTGIFDSKWLTNKGHMQISPNLKEMREVAVITNKEFAKAFKINQSTAITCVKPSGTVSQLVDSASGIHPRHAPYYIRRVRGDSKDPLTRFLMDAGVPCEADVTNSEVMVFDFPQKAPMALKKPLTALQHLDLWKTYQDSWCEHKPSITVSVEEDEWMEVGAWVYENFDDVSGISFLPKSDHSYRQAPYEEITKEKYEELIAASPKDIDWAGLSEYELEDNTDSSQTLACSADGCEVVNIGNA